jgi:hypothetical protein
MFGSNEPREFTLTPANLFDNLIKWMPAQLERMRQFESGAIKVGDGIRRLECQYIQTIGGEKFRIVDLTPFGDSGSDYYSPLGADEDVVLAFAKRVEDAFAFCRRAGEIRKDERPIELMMTFAAGPFDRPATDQDA